MPLPEPPIPELNVAAIQERVRREFLPDQQAEVLAELHQYKGVSVEAQARIHHAILKLASGDLKKLRHYLNEAKSDFRNVLYWAYYPEESKITRDQAQVFIDRLRKAGLKNLPNLPGKD